MLVNPEQIKNKYERERYIEIQKSESYYELVEIAQNAVQMYVSLLVCTEEQKSIYFRVFNYVHDRIIQLSNSSPIKILEPSF